MVPERRTAILVLLVGLCLMAAPGAGRAIGNGDTVFDYEADLDLSGIAEDGDQLAMYFDDDPTKGMIFSIPVANAANLDLTQIDMQGNYGTYYLMRDTAKKIYIRNPEIYFGVCLENDLSASIAGKTVTKNTPIAFRFDATEVGTFLISADVATVNVRIVTPGGGIIHEIPDAAGLVQNFTGLPLNAPRTYYRNIDISQLEEGTYTTNAVWATPTGFADYATDSNVVIFSVATKEISIVSNKENVVRNYPFVVTITGDFKTDYYLYIKNASLAAANQYPTIKPGQPSVTITNVAFALASDPAADTLANNERAIVGGAYVPGTAAFFTTSSNGGTRSIEFTTATDDGQIFTIKVLDPRDTTRCDEVTVTVERGAVTLTAEGSGVYYVGDEIRLSVTNTDTRAVYLFLTSPEIAIATGIALDNVSAHAADGHYTVCLLEGGDSYLYRWDTSVLAPLLDEGTCRVYAVSAATDDTGAPVDADHLEGVVYCTADIILKKPFISASVNDVSISQGGTLSISGQATGNPPAVQMWIFGEGCRVMGEQGSNLSYYQDGQWSYSLQSEDTINFSGDYYVIAQHPMGDGEFGVRPLHPENLTDSWIIEADGTVTDLATLSPIDAAQAVTDAVFSPSCDDTAAMVSFHVEESRYIRFDVNFLNENENERIDDGTITFMGHSNYPVGTPLTWTVTPYNGTAVCTSGSTIIESLSYYPWQFSLDLKTLEGGDYAVTLSSQDGAVQDRLNFTLYGGSEPIYPESADYGVECAFVYPSVAEPFQTDISSKLFTVLATMNPADKNGTPFSSGDALQIGNLQYERVIFHDPIRYTIAVNGNDVMSRSDYGIITINGWDLAYPAGVDVDVYLMAQCHAINPTSDPSVPEVDGLKTVTIQSITQLAGGSTPIPGSAFMINLTSPGDGGGGGGGSVVGPPAYNSTAFLLSSGWNFVSTPKTLAAGSDTAAIFAGVDTAGHSILRYDTLTGAWAALKPTDPVRPLEGYWIYAATATEIPLTYATASPQAPATRTLTTGWNAIGFSDTEPATARDTLVSLGSAWSVLMGFDGESQTYETSIIRGGSGDHSDSGWMLPAKGYWLYMTGNGTLAAIGA
ncbi:hypothetical protein Metli_2019 [Methanofollis liminatans DSM 4140]|uniref:PKD domain-containing protein n=1 Tax=Methanofollis liminatans DSM 4140 TaxID=28892 RepID=J0S245_9EURY|nr:DUF3821 domain-containing protein [Methanofollis liminatans]EJG07961.1 hypothetical protein Metli_2019 [Methanofollis liminatans DSM 4140]